MIKRNFENNVDNNGLRDHFMVLFTFVFWCEYTLADVLWPRWTGFVSMLISFVGGLRSMLRETRTSRKRCQSCNPGFNRRAQDATMLCRSTRGKQTEPRVLQDRCNTLVLVPKGKHGKPFDLNELRTIAMRSNVLWIVLLNDAILTTWKYAEYFEKFLMILCPTFHLLSDWFLG